MLHYCESVNKELKNIPSSGILKVLNVLRTLLRGGKIIVLLINSIQALRTAAYS